MMLTAAAHPADRLDMLKNDLELFRGRINWSKLILLTFFSFVADGAQRIGQNRQNLGFVPFFYALS